MFYLLKIAINELMLGVLEHNFQAEIIPFEPDSARTDEGKWTFDQTLVINFKIFSYEKFLDKTSSR